MAADSIINKRHPTYAGMLLRYKKFRLTFEGGLDFIDHYLVRYSKRETQSEFTERKKTTYCPAHAKSELNKIANAIYQRMGDIVRNGGTMAYKEAVVGRNRGVDRHSATMTSFIGGEVLPELLALGRVGVYVDRPQLPDAISRADVAAFSPYLYIYKCEDILSWHHDEEDVLDAVLLRDYEDTPSDVFGIVDGTDVSYRYLERKDDGIHVTFYNDAGDETSSLILDLAEIPFVICQLRESMLTDAADYQIALLNLGSSDMGYALKSNFPFYTEQYDLREVMASNMQAGAAHDENGNLLNPGTEAEANTAKTDEIVTGIGQGRRYAKDLERPKFIHPSPEPLKISMLKQEGLQQEIRDLMQMSLEKLTAEGNADNGLAFIGAVLEQCEREIANIWMDYEKSSEDVLIRYPRNYTLRTDEALRAEAKELEAQIAKTPSSTLRKELAKQVAYTLMGTKVSQETLDKIYQEIDDLDVIVTDREVIRLDHEAGFLSTELASSLCGYPEGQVEQAKKDHADRLYRIAIMQSKASNASDAARGIDDSDPDPSRTASDEKKSSRLTDQDDVVRDKTRGDGQ